jgi:N-acetylglucosamine kinase-like BadF-type ATPase
VAERNRLATKIEVVGDVALPIALLPEHCGIVIVAGTGSCVWGQAADGRTSRSGGWGPIMGDEGSGYGIAVSALQAITRAADGRARSTSLTERLLGRMNLAEPTRLVAAIHGGEWDRAKLAMLASDVIRAADEGDSIAKEIVGHHVEELADSVAAVVRRLGMARDGLALALAGGLLTRAPTYRDRLLVDLGNRGLHPGHVIEVSEPADGAVRRAAARLTSS